MLELNQIRLHQMPIATGDFDANGNEILRRMDKDRQDGIRLSVFPQLALSGYLEASEWANPDRCKSLEKWQRQIIAATGKDHYVIFGTAWRWEEYMLNAAVAAGEGKIIPPENSPLEFRPKMSFSQLDEASARFDHFCFKQDATTVAYKLDVPVSSILKPFMIDGSRITIGLDCDSSPGLIEISAQNLCINLTSTPYAIRSTPGGRGFSGCSYTCGGVGVVDTGHALFTLFGGTGRNASGVSGERRLLPLLKPGTYTLGEDDALENFDNLSRPYPEVASVIEFALKAQLERLGILKVVIGASGGIDSTLSAAIYSRVLPPENLLLVNMPTHNNSQTTISLAKQLATNLGCNYVDVPIEESLQLTLRQLDGLQCSVPATGKAGVRLQLSPLAVENVQARDRSGRVLSAIASAFGGVFTCNANKSECTVGYGTMYGDISGFFCVLADLWKLEVWDLARCYNREIFGREVIPQGSIDIVPSAELSAAQNVNEGKGDPLVYPWHDRVFAAWTERMPILTPSDMLDLYDSGNRLADEIGYDGDVRRLFPAKSDLAMDLDRYWKLFNGLARAKRLQAPPLLSLKRRSYGFDLGAAQAVCR